MALKIYTKTGDKGETGLLGGTRVPKFHIRIEAYGTVDELNAHIGLVRDQLADEAIAKLLIQIQESLFTLGALLATDPDKQPGFSLPDITTDDITALEQAIDAMDSKLPPMKHFVLPGGHPVVSQLHIARCVCRRAERRVVELDMQGGKVPEKLVVYLNRLSDYLFVLSRFVAMQLQATEIAWKPRS